MADKKLGLHDIIDLSVVELYILNYLVKISASTVRFAVFQDINAQLEENKISRSSFYNSLKKLETKGLVDIRDNPQGTGNLVQATELSKEAIKQVNVFSIWGSLDPDTKIKELLMRDGKSVLGEKVNSQLIISFDQFVHIPLLEIMSSYSTKNSLLASDDQFEKINQQSITSLSITRLEDNIIKEPDNYFERIILYRYQTNAIFMGSSSQIILEEAVRILKPGSKIIIIELDDLPKTNNLLLESMFSDLLEANLPEFDEDIIQHLVDNRRCKIVSDTTQSGFRIITLEKN